jgi:PTH1 family peptidyl-tRNA hydrolase
VVAIIGLGNPGARYAGTRHNLGFRVADGFAARLRARCEGSGNLAHYELWRANAGERPLLIVMPETFMNLSGVAVRSLQESEGISPGSMLVVCDDVNLPLGRLRLRSGGSDGGHNGLKSVIEELGTTEFPRLRLGVGPRPQEIALSDFVLGEFEAAEAPVVETLVERGVQAAVAVAEQGLEAAMREFNAMRDLGGDGAAGEEPPGEAPRKEN